MKKRIGILVFCMTIIWDISAQSPILFPNDAVVNILSYGANLNDGITNATPAILQAIDEHDGDLFTRRILYFPAGNYLVEESIVVDAISATGGGTGKSIVFQGAGSDFTTIRLKDNTFTDPSNAQPVLSTTEGGRTVGGFTNIAFMTSIFNLTVDVGIGNPGAIGIRYVANNQGTIRDVVVKSSDPNKAGYAGIDMENATIAGPALIKNVSITGFDWGIRIATLNYGMTMEDILIRDAKKGGIWNSQHIVSIRKLTTQNINGPSVLNVDKDGFMVLLESDLQGIGDYAIQNSGFMFARTVASSGYTHTIQDVPGNVVLDGAVEEWLSHESKASATGAPQKSLNLGNGNIPETPEAVWTDTVNWVSVLDFGYNLNGDDAGPAIQAAIDFMNEPGNENQNVLYFPWGRYNIKTPVRVWGNVLKIIGNYAGFYTTNFKDGLPEPLFLIENTLYPELFIERFNVVPQDRRKKFSVFHNNSSKDLVLRNVYVGHGKIYKKGSATGRLFIEDVCALSQVYYTKVEDPFDEAVPQFDFGNQEVWARQFNNEQRFTHAETDGGQLWVLGIKTEEPGTVVHAKNGAKFELLGGTILPSFADIGEHMFVIENSEASIIVTEHISYPKFESMAWYKNIIKEVRGDVVFELNFLQFPKRNFYGTAIPLYVGYGGTVTPNYEIELNKTELNVGDVEINQEITEQVTVFNRGNTMLHISDISVPDGFSSDWTTRTINVNASAKLNISFAPSEVKAYGGELIVRSNAMQGDSVLTLTGNGLPVSTRILGIEGSLNFGEIEVGSSETLSINLVNTGNDALTIADIVLIEGFEADWNAGVIAAGASQAVNITFAPQEIADFSSSLRVSSNLTSGRNSLLMTAKGIATITSVDGQEEANIHIYPNPSQNEVFIQVEGISGAALLTITTLKGSKVHESQLMHGQNLVEIPFNLQQGVYLLKIETKSFTKISKIIIH